MKSSLWSLAVVALAVVSVPAANAAELKDLKVLYIGKERTSDFVTFLTGEVAVVVARTRSEFQPSQASDFDVVLFDWPQGDETRDMRKLGSPLGAREKWNRPTVLLGSAG